ncbi:hypothetical protein LWI29_036215 [Acer saccharum]|uniref:Uncharacterized protein n=1 Tax=Acer saccharum TaxID=4024 RepID=A0AA39W1J8_ACESA|nr:hypothetical protein LWI29_036215 [Acer saccharum]
MLIPLLNSLNLESNNLLLPSNASSKCKMANLTSTGHHEIGIFTFPNAISTMTSDEIGIFTSPNAISTTISKQRHQRPNICPTIQQNHFVFPFPKQAFFCVNSQIFFYISFSSTRNGKQE